MPEKILAIDDENDVLLIIRTALESEGYEILTASNGVDGLAIAREEKPDLIILDMMMPEMGGEEVIEELKNDPETDTIRVMILTAISERKKIQEMLDKGADYYIVKPFEFKELIDKVRNVLDEDLPLI